MTDAPFVIRPPIFTSDDKPNERNRAGPSFGTVLSKDGKAEGNLYWNHEIVSSALVCGASNKEVLKTILQTLRIHLNESSSSALIFHANERDHILPPSQITTIQIGKRLNGVTVFGPPRLSKNLRNQYSDIPLPPSSILPLRISEKDISIAHVLELFTPPEGFPAREGVRAKVEGIISQMQGFEIQEFNRLIDEETWDSDSASFIGLRQTMLTTLTLLDEEDRGIGTSKVEGKDIASRIKAGGPIIVDLSDPVLRSSGIDAVLFDIILCLYCTSTSDKKLLLLDQPSLYLPTTSSSTSSPLLNTLNTLNTLHSSSPLRTLISTTSLPDLPPRLLNHVDTFICHAFQAPEWLSYLQRRISFSIEERAMYGLDSRQAVVVSPRSVVQTASQAEEPNHQRRNGLVHGNRWGYQAWKVDIGWEWPLSVEQQKIEQLQALVAQLTHNAPPHPHAHAHRTLSHHVPGAHSSHHVASASTYPSAIAGNALGGRRRTQSTYVETTMNALRSALGYLASRRTMVSGESSFEDSPSVPAIPPANSNRVLPSALGNSSLGITDTPQTRVGHARTETGTGTMVTELDISGGAEERKEMEKSMEPVIIEERESSGQESEWMKKPVLPDPSLTTPPKVDMRDFGPFETTLSEKPSTKSLQSGTSPSQKSRFSPRQLNFPPAAPPYESQDPTSPLGMKYEGSPVAGNSITSSLPDRKEENSFSNSAKYDKAKLTTAILRAIKMAGGETGIPISSQKVGDAFQKTAPADVFRVPFPTQAVEVRTVEVHGEGWKPEEGWQMSEVPPYRYSGGGTTNVGSWRMSIPPIPGGWRTSMPPAPTSAMEHKSPSDPVFRGVASDGFSTWKEITDFAEKEGIVKVVSNGKEEWLVMPNAPGATLKLDDVDGDVVKGQDGWYEKQPLDNSIYEPLLQTLFGLREKQTIIQVPFLLHSVSYELKRRFPTAIREAGFKTVLEYIHGAQSRGLVEISDDSSGSIYVQLADPNRLKPPGSILSASTNQSQPDSSAVPSSEADVPYPSDRFEPLLAVLRSLKKHNLYKVTLIPLSLAIEKMFPNAMARFGVAPGGVEGYVIQARDAGLVITGKTANGNLWVSLAENLDTNGSTTPTQEKPGKAHSAITTSDFHLPASNNNRVSDFSRLLRAIRALAPQPHERVLCSRVGMMLNKEDYKAMNVETFSQALIAASKANLVVHGGIGGSAWVALKAPEVAGVTNAKNKPEEPRARLIKTSPPEIATNPVVPSGSAYKLPLSEADIEPFKPLLIILRTFIHGKHIAEPFRTVVEKNLLKTRPDVLSAAKCNTMDDYILRAQSYGLIAQVGNGKASRLRLLENSGLSIV